MKKLHYIYVFFAFIVLCAGCRKDEIKISAEDELIPVVEDVTFQFLITNESGEPIEAAQLSLNAENYVSDENGIIITSPQSVSSLGTKSQIFADGYDPLVKVVGGASGAVKQERVILFKSVSSVISSGSSGDIDSGGTLTLPSALIADDGSTYSGEVTVKHKYLNPDNKDFLLSAPGNLLALNRAEEYQQLASYGMYMIELFDANGGVLKIPDGSTAIIEFPIADIHKNDIESNIPLWYFDEDSGLWKEDGIAHVQGDKLIAEVSHFTWWNCDLPYDFAVICLVFWDSDGEVMPGLEVEFSVNGAAFGVAVTDANGAILAKIPVGETVDLKYFVDGVEVGAQSIGPFDESERKEIVNTELDLAKIFGTALDCNGELLSNGYGFINVNDNISFFPLADNGSFSYYAPGVEHDLVLVNVASNKTKILTISMESQLEDLVLGEVEICEDENTAKVSGHVLIDTDKDNIGDSPSAMAPLSIFNITDEVYDEISCDENGYYEVVVLPGKEYKIAVLHDVEEYRAIMVGDNTPDGDNTESSFADGGGHRFNFVSALQGEHDSDNDFLLIPSGEGIISGNAFADTNGDGMADTPLEWAYVNYDLRPGGSSEIQALVDMDGAYSSPDISGFYSLFLTFDFFTYSFISSLDTTPDPDGGDIGGGSFGFIHVVLQDGETDADNNFVVDHSIRKTLLCQVLEDTDADGIGDIPLEGIRIKRVDRATGSNGRNADTDQFGIIRFFNMEGSAVDEFTLTIESGGYEIIDIVDTSEDGDPLILNGDTTKMEIDLEVGEWDAGNIFVVRKN